MGVVAAILAGGLLFAAFVVGLRWNARLLRERPHYAVERAEPPFQIRRYPRLWAAEVRRDGGRLEAVKQGFSPLEDYVSGRERPGRKMAMTAPVLQEASTEGSWKIRCLMSPKLAREEIPDPRRDDVRLVELPERIVAAVRFSGSAGDPRFETKAKDLETWATQQGYAPKGPVTFAYYDAPFMPPVLRRNELLLELDPSSQDHGVRTD